MGTETANSERGGCIHRPGAPAFTTPPEAVLRWPTCGRPVVPTTEDVTEGFPPAYCAEHAATFGLTPAPNANVDEVRVRPKFLRRGVGRIVRRGRLTIDVLDGNGSRSASDA